MNGRGSRKKPPTGRVEGGFVALPWDVLDSAAYGLLSHPARSLLLEIARQYVRDNNGRLLTSRAHLFKRGWKSADVITRAIRELEAAGFIHQTVKGQRPNRASWWAVTWQKLDRHPDFDAGVAATFRRAAYRNDEPLLKNAGLRPSGGATGPVIAPRRGVGVPSVAPSGGAIAATSGALATPPGGNHLEKPSAAALGQVIPLDPCPVPTLANALH